MKCRGWGIEDLHKAFKPLPAKEQQNLWKMFERDRRANSADAQYKSLTNGPGSGSKKHEFLRGWLSDGFSIGEHYRRAVVSFEIENRHKLNVGCRGSTPNSDNLVKP